MEKSESKFPKKLNLGSGKDFRADFLNLDFKDTWHPDIIVDLNEPFPKGNSEIFMTKRFGEIQITKNMFDLIVAHDVLEHIRNLTVAMKSCLDVLKEGGQFDISVPYDLSYGAWQDPTHIRAFNEQSWRYYVEWFWYLGWTEARFDVEKFSLVTSSFGIQLQKKGVSSEEIIRTPRAIDQMNVLLKKVPLSEEEREQYHEYRQGPGISW